MRVLACALLTLLAMVGCTASPEVRVLALERVSTGTNADEFAMRLELRNPNTSPLVLDRWSYSVSTPTGSWSTEWIATRTLPARSITIERLPVVIPHATATNQPTDSTTASAIDALPLSWRASGSLTYLLPGQLAETLFDLGVSRPDVGFSGSGTSAAPGAEAPAVDRQ
ncbi:MAG: hypothetical protein ACKO4V_05825 [Planctomycetota bacterium]